MADLKFNILEEFGTLSTSKSGWELQLNFVQWGDNQPKFDLRTWSPDHKKMGKGLTLNHDELVNLQDAIEKVLAPEQIVGSQNQASVVGAPDEEDAEEEKPAWGKLSDM